jgi:hypothetical protein
MKDFLSLAEVAVRFDPDLTQPFPLFYDFLFRGHFAFPLFGSFLYTFFVVY